MATPRQPQFRTAPGTISGIAFRPARSNWPRPVEYLLRRSAADGSLQAHLDEHQIGKSAAPPPQSDNSAAAYRSQLLVRHRLPISKQPLAYRFLHAFVSHLERELQDRAGTVA